MRKLIAAFTVLAWVGPVAAGAQPERMAYLQDRNIFHSGLSGTHTVALTFDDGPNAHTADVLDVLKTQHVPATFFIVGRMGHLHPKLLARIANEGHLLANHSASHQPFDAEYAEDPSLLLDELRVVDDQIRPLMPEGTHFFFRAPYGIWRSEYAQLLNADPVLKNYIGPVFWDEGGEMAEDTDGSPLSASDWQCWKRGWDVAHCADGYLNEIRSKNGGVVLMHCIHAQSAGLLAAVLPPLIDEGFDFVRLNDVPDYRKYETPPPEAGAAVASAAPVHRNTSTN